MSELKRLNVTQKQYEWLLHLEKVGADKRDGWRNSPCYVMRIGLTDWARDDNGNMDESYIEILTDKGKEYLAYRRNSNEYQ